MNLRVLAYTAATLPLLAAFFVAGVVFERNRAQPVAVQLGSDASSDPAIAPKVQETIPKPAAVVIPAEQRGREPGSGFDDPNLGRAVRAIEAAWRVASESEQLLAVKIGNCYGARFIRRGAEISVEPHDKDVPALVRIHIRGRTAENLPTGKSTCRKSIGDVLSASRHKSEDLEPLDATLSYKVTATALTLERITSEPGWLAIAVGDNVRLNLLSWKSLAQQRINGSSTDAAGR